MKNLAKGSNSKENKKRKPILKKNLAKDSNSKEKKKELQFEESCKRF